MDSPNTGTADGDSKADALSIRKGTGAAKEGRTNLSTETVDANRANNLGPNVDKRANKQTVTSNKACMSILFLQKVVFILIFFLEFEIALALLFISFLSLVTLVKQKANFFRYSIIKMWMLCLNNALLGMTSTLALLKFFTRYSQFWEISPIYPLLITLSQELLKQDWTILLSFCIAIIWHGM